VAIGVLLCVVPRRDSPGRTVLAAAFCLPLLVGGLALAIEAGGIVPLWSALADHAHRHVTGLSGAEHGFAASGLARSLIHPAVAVAWLVLFHVGMIRLIRAGGWRDLAPLLVGALAPLVVVIQLLSNPMHARYTIPVLALTCGFVALGLETLLRRWTWPVVAAIAGVATLVVAPQLAAYRSTVSPPVAGLEAAISEAERSQSAIIIDEELHAFWRLRMLEAPVTPLVSLQPIPNGAEASSGLHNEPIRVVDLTRRNASRNGEVVARFSTEIPLAIRLSQDRFLDVVVDR
jgi:hypothetical protein